jgi:hypothetical protein
MALSDQLSKLAARAKEAEDRVAAAKTKARAQLEQDVQAARDAAGAEAEELRKAVEADTEAISAWWTGVQKNWSDHISEIRRNIGEKRAAVDAKVAKREADHAEKDAAFAVDFALGAVEEAEYAVLYATLSRMDAEKMAAA